MSPLARLWQALRAILPGSRTTPVSITGLAARAAVSRSGCGSKQLNGFIDFDLAAIDLLLALDAKTGPWQGLSSIPDTSLPLGEPADAGRALFTPFVPHANDGAHQASF